MTVLNTIVAESLDEICTILEPVKDKPEEFHATLNKLLQNIIKKHKRILFSGETLYIPAVTEQLTPLTTAIAQMKASGIKAGMKATTDRANQIGTLLDILPGQVRELRRAVDEADTRAIQTGMDNLRSTIDMLESLTDADLWPVPTYAELLFL